MVETTDFNSSVPLPPGLTLTAIRKSIEYIERELADLVEVYFEQANVFSALVGIFGAKALDSTSVYEKSRHADIAQQRFPDLRRKGSGADPSPNESLESKASKRAWALQSHYDHAGWYIVWRYLVDPTMSLEQTDRSSSGELRSCFLRKAIGSTRAAEQERQVAVGLIPSD